MALNSLCSLYAHQLDDPQAFAAADRLLFIPDLLHYWLSGERTTEATIASTSQMIDCHTGDWAREMVAELGLPTKILGPITSPATDDRQATFNNCRRDWLAVRIASCRAWCTRHGERRRRGAREERFELVLFVERHVVTARCGTRRAVRIGRGSSRLVHQRVGRRRHDSFFEKYRRVVARAGVPSRFARRGQEFDYPTLTQLASEAPAFRTLVDPGHSSFLLPGDMPQKIAEFARATGQPVPESPGQFIRCCLESLGAWRIEKSCRRSSRSSIGDSMCCISSAAAEKMHFFRR